MPVAVLSEQRRKMKPQMPFSMASQQAALASPEDCEAEFARLRHNWVEQRVGSADAVLSAPRMGAFVAALDAEAKAWLSLMVRVERSLFTDPASSGQEVYNTRITAERLRVLATAFATPGSRFFAEERLLVQIEKALAFLLRYRFNLSKPPVGNWWEWQIGVPMPLLDILLILHERLPESLIKGLALAINHHSGDPRFADKARNGRLPATAANQVWKSHVLFLNSVLLRRPDGISDALHALTDTFAYVEAGDGGGSRPTPYGPSSPTVQGSVSTQLKRLSTIWSSHPRSARQVGAGGRGRTGIALRLTDFKSVASTSFATPALVSPV